MKSTLKLLVLSLFISSILYSCKPDDDEPPVTDTTGFEVLLLNEGQFGAGDGTLGGYDADSKTYSGEIYNEKNNEGMGNIVQSVYKHNNSFYWVINNAQKVIITNEEYVKTGTISGVTSPRQMIIHNDKAYITDLFANGVWIYDLDAGTAPSKIDISGWTDAIAMVNNEIWVAQQGGTNIFIIDPSTDMITDSISVVKSPASLVEDKNGSIWVMSQGDGTTATPTMQKIDPSTKMITSSFGLTATYPTHLKINAAKDELYYLNGDIYKFDINASAEPSTFHISTDGYNPYSLGIDPSNGDIYAADAGDFTSNSQIYRYDESGANTDVFTAGVITGNYYFLP